MTVDDWRRWVLWVGIGGTIGLVFFGLWTLVSRVWAASLTQTLEVLVAAPFLAAWVLSPLLWAAWPRREPPPPRAGSMVSTVAAALLVGVAAYAYLPEFIVLPLFFDVQPGLESLILVLIVPGWQWAILMTAGAIRWAQSRRPIGGPPEA